MIAAETERQLGSEAESKESKRKKTGDIAATAEVTFTAAIVVDTTLTMTLTAPKTTTGTATSI